MNGNNYHTIKVRDIEIIQELRMKHCGYLRDRLGELEKVVLRE